MGSLDRQLVRHRRGRDSYLTDVLALSADLEAGRLYLITVMHDDWCAQLRGRGFCNCDPVTLPPRRVNPAAAEVS